MLRSRSGSRQTDQTGNNPLDCVIAPPAEFHDNADTVPAATTSIKQEEKILNVEAGMAFEIFFMCRRRTQVIISRAVMLFWREFGVDTLDFSLDKCVSVLFLPYRIFHDF